MIVGGEIVIFWIFLLLLFVFFHLEISVSRQRFRIQPIGRRKMSLHFGFLCFSSASFCLFIYHTLYLLIDAFGVISQTFIFSNFRQLLRFIVDRFFPLGAICNGAGLLTGYLCQFLLLLLDIFWR